MLNMSRKTTAVFACACACVLCLALVGCGGSSSASSASASASSSAASASSASSTAVRLASSSASASVLASASAAASAASASSSDLVDDHLNITLCAIFESTGPELVDLMQEQGYEWDAANARWFRSVDGASFAVLRNAGVLSKDEYGAATTKGGLASAVSSSVVGGWKDAEAALSGNAHCVIEDSYVDETGSCIAIVYGPSMVEYLVIAQQNSESTVELDIYSKEAVGSGMLDQVYGKQVGGSFKEVWKNFTGQDSYGH